MRPPVHAIERPEPPPNPLFGTIKICIDYDSSLLLQRFYREVSLKLDNADDAPWLSAGRSWGSSASVNRRRVSSVKKASFGLVPSHLSPCVAPSSTEATALLIEATWTREFAL